MKPALQAAGAGRRTGASGFSSMPLAPRAMPALGGSGAFMPRSPASARPAHTLAAREADGGPLCRAWGRAERLCPRREALRPCLVDGAGTAAVPGRKRPDSDAHIRVWG